MDSPVHILSRARSEAAADQIRLEEAFKAGAEWAVSHRGIEPIPASRRGARRVHEEALAQAAREFATN